MATAKNMHLQQQQQQQQCIAVGLSLTDFE